MVLIVIPQWSESKGYWESIGDALEASHCLRSLHVHFPLGWSRGLSMMKEGLCMNERLTELSIDTDDPMGMYRVSDM